MPLPPAEEPDLEIEAFPAPFPSLKGNEGREGSR